ncbi:hypothetical protein IP91_02129 [Pseudoduganella lurida]|uniref:Preprotein translocase subunit SecD n=1 Tax=Pseudoduganella lurida TaxID=1036180 RepID=A0A562RB77_9BURK|nr:hypothetical protein [Pseudoduganella lurida]TWI66317.1 hypothetical protein IP91_02129 [Pseudoduganella lurida]
MRAEEVLPDAADSVVRDGVTVRKGTVGAFLANALAWGAPQLDAAGRAAIERDLADSLPALRALRFFEVLEIRDPALRAFVAACQ